MPVCPCLRMNTWLNCPCNMKKPAPRAHKANVSKSMYGWQSQWLETSKLPELFSPSMNFRRAGGISFSEKNDSICTIHTQSEKRRLLFLMFPFMFSFFSGVAALGRGAGGPEGCGRSEAGHRDPTGIRVVVRALALSSGLKVLKRNRTASARFFRPQYHRWGPVGV